MMIFLRKIAANCLRRKEGGRSLTNPEKWREMIDPFSLTYHSFCPTEVLGYPHAGNDVFHVKGIFHDTEVKAYIKVARQHGADIENEVHILSQMSGVTFPTILDYDFEKTPFSVTRELPGERLSTIVNGNENHSSFSYMAEYGAALAKLHRLTPHAEKVKDRKFFHAPSDELLESLSLNSLRSVFKKHPKNQVQCFCHGDFHYANILWDDHHISGILDFELSGYGNRDFDIAWALFRRPGLDFLKTSSEQEEFLYGYSQSGKYDRATVNHYMAQCYVYFLQFSHEDTEYCDYVRGWLADFV